jgi:hypothetical protein
MSIEHIASEIRKPTTLCKIERWLHTYEEELRRDRSLEDAARFYNVIMDPPELRVQDSDRGLSEAPDVTTEHNFILS